MDSFILLECWNRRKRHYCIYPSIDQATMPHPCSLLFIDLLKAFCKISIVVGILKWRRRLVNFPLLWQYMRDNWINKGRGFFCFVASEVSVPGCLNPLLGAIAKTVHYGGSTWQMNRAYLMATRKLRNRQEGAKAPIPSLGQVSCTRLYLLKFPSLSNSTKLSTKLLTYRPLLSTHDPSYRKEVLLFTRHLKCSELDKWKGNDDGTSTMS